MLYEIVIENFSLFGGILLNYFIFLGGVLCMFLKNLINLKYILN